MGVLDSSYIKALGVKSPELKKIFVIFTDTLIYIYIRVSVKITNIFFSSGDFTPSAFMYEESKTPIA